MNQETERSWTVNRLLDGKEVRTQFHEILMDDPNLHVFDRMALSLPGRVQQHQLW